MDPTNVPVSLLAANPDVRYLVLIRQIWHRSRATIAPRVPVAPSIPQEVVEMIIAHLIYDKPSLIACSLTCRSWYIASAPHLHHTLVLKYAKWGRRAWPKPLQEPSKLGLLPLVNKLQLHWSLTNVWRIGSPPRLFNHNILCQISGLTNVRELDMECLDISALMPELQKYFGHFLPRLQSLSLRVPKGSNRQIIFFIGLFERLEDLTLTGTFFPCQPFDDPTLIPPSNPPLRGRLVMVNFYQPHFSEEMIKLFERIRFRYMSIYSVQEPQLLLNACAETLETVELNPTEFCSEQSQSQRVTSG